MNNTGIAMFGMRILTSEHIPQFREEQVRKHVKSGSQRQAYHDRINKKWLKRFGVEKVPCAYIFDAGAVGMFGDKTLALHPAQLAKLLEGIRK